MTKTHQPELHPFDRALLAIQDRAHETELFKSTIEKVFSIIDGQKWEERGSEALRAAGGWSMLVRLHFAECSMGQTVTGSAMWGKTIALKNVLNEADVDALRFRLRFEASKRYRLKEKNVLTKDVLTAQGTFTVSIDPSTHVVVISRDGVDLASAVWSEDEDEGSTIDEVKATSEGSASFSSSTWERLDRAVEALLEEKLSGA